MTHRVLAFGLALLLLPLSACGDDSGESTTTANPGASTLASRCKPSSDAASRPTGDDLRNSFVDPGGQVRFLLESDEVAPGQAFEAALANDSTEPIIYGESYKLQRLQGDRWVPARSIQQADRSIGLIAEPGGVGPCITMGVAKGAPGGEYRAVARYSPEQSGKMRITRTEFSVVE